MRTKIFLVAPLFGLGLMAVGCGDDGQMADMTVPPDMTVLPDMKPPPDMVPPVKYSGTVVLAEASGAILVMGAPVPVKVLQPVVGFASSANAKKPDYTSVTNPNLPLGCTGNHYDIAKGDAPEEEIEGGNVVLKGYKPAPPLGQMMNVPDSITCSWSTMKKTYGCVFTGTMLDPGVTPFAATADTLPMDTMLNFIGAGGGNIGTFDDKAVPVAGGIMVMENLNTIKYDPTKDTNLNFTCPGGSCLGSVAVVNLQIMQDPPSANTFGAVRCANLIMNAPYKIDQKAIAAGFGCTEAGANCNTTLKTVRTVVLRVPLPSAKMDSKGNGLTLLGGHGVFGVATQ